MTAPTPKFVTFHQYAGYLVRGVDPVTISAEDQCYHMKVAACLTAMLECVHFGTVQGYDGAGLSGGLLHHIAVQPHSLEQGSLWGLLAAIASSAPTEYVWVATALAPWRVGQDGVLRDEHGAKVTGQAIRGRLNGSPDGKTPPGDDRAKGFALLFNRLLSSPATRKAQLDYAIHWLTTGQRETEQKAYHAFGVTDPLGDRSQMPAEVDLAMSVYHAFSANGPGPAREILVRALGAFHAPESASAFAHELIRSCGLSKFGRWHDDPMDEGSRYDATRKACLASGFWPHDLIERYMPRNLV